MPKKRKYPWYEKLQCYRKQVKMPDGHYKPVYADTEAEMDAKLETLKKEIQHELNTKLDPTAAQYAVKWFRLNTPELSPSRVRDYCIAINKYILPVIGNKKLRDVTQEDGKEIMVSMKDMSNSLQANVVCVLRNMFDDAEDDKLIIRTPFRRLKAGGYKSEEKTPLTDKQSSRLIAAVRGTKVYPFIMIGLYAGLRKEEILGLRWPNIHLEGNAPYIAVKERVTYDQGKPIHEPKLKSKASFRNVPIPLQLVECLTAEKECSPSDFVISNPQGQPRSAMSFRRLWQMVENRTIGPELNPETGKPMLDKKGNIIMQELGSYPAKHPDVVRLLDFKVTPHILRHTYITNLCRSGMNLKKIQYLAGHATAQITLNIYIHATENQPEDLAAEIKNAFKFVEANAEDKAKNQANNIVDFREWVAAQ